MKRSMRSRVSFRWRSGMHALKGSSRRSFLSSPRRLKSHPEPESQAVQAHVGLLTDAVLSPAPDEDNAEAIQKVLDSCEAQHKGAGATLALGYLDTVWWLPAPIRPEIGALAILAVYEALRRFEVFTRYPSIMYTKSQIDPAGM